jgi:hypothetical protein
MLPHARLKSGADSRSEETDRGRAESRRRYALARPCSATLLGLETGRDVGLAKSGFRPTSRRPPIANHVSVAAAVCNGAGSLTIGVSLPTRR